MLILKNVLISNESSNQIQKNSTPQNSWLGFAQMDRNNKIPTKYSNNKNDKKYNPIQIHIHKTLLFLQMVG